MLISTDTTMFLAEPAVAEWAAPCSNGHDESRRPGHDLALDWRCAR